MAKLILSLDGILLKEQELTKERTTIGRKAHNDIQIDNLAVSGEHAVIVTILNDSFLEDMGSTNGTVVNGASVKKHFLQNSDVIEIGKYKLKYINEAASTTTAADFEKTMVLRAPMAGTKGQAGARIAGDTQLGGHAAARTHGVGTVTSLNRAATMFASNPAHAAIEASGTVGSAHSAPAGAKIAASQAPGGVDSGSSQLAAAVAGLSRSIPVPAFIPPQAVTVSPPECVSMPLAAIQILTGPSAGREMELLKSLTTVGKPGVQVSVITRRPQGYYITHVEGTSFPILNGKSLDGQAHSLNDHDIVELAGVKMEFFLKS
jgi:predicted component of type VI protein secretion system